MLLQAWESGAAAGPLDRAPSLLHSLGAVPASVRTEELSVGQCDARLFELRRAMFGEMLEVVATCPACQTEVELTVALAELQPPVREGHVPPLTVQADGYTLVCRIPCNEDLRVLARRGGEVTFRDLLERCVLEVTPPGRPLRHASCRKPLRRRSSKRWPNPTLAPRPRCGCAAPAVASGSVSWTFAT